jgi:hypothetical protein
MKSGDGVIGAVSAGRIFFERKLNEPMKTIDRGKLANWFEF